MKTFIVSWLIVFNQGNYPNPNQRNDFSYVDYSNCLSRHDDLIIERSKTFHKLDSAIHFYNKLKLKGRDSISILCY